MKQLIRSFLEKVVIKHKQIIVFCRLKTSILRDANLYQKRAQLKYQQDIPRYNFLKA